MHVSNLGVAAFWPTSQINGNFDDSVASFQRLDRQLRLYFKAARKKRKLLHDAPVEYAISGKHVFDMGMKNRPREPQKQVVSQPIRSAKLTPAIGVQARTYHHIGFMIQHWF